MVNMNKIVLVDGAKGHTDTLLTFLTFLEKDKYYPIIFYFESKNFK